MPEQVTADDVEKILSQSQPSGGGAVSADDVDRVLGKTAEQTSRLGAFSRSVGTGVLPAAGAALGGQLGWGLGLKFLPEAAAAAPETAGLSLLVPLGASLAGGLLGSAITERAQRSALKAVSPETAERLETLETEDIAQHPRAAMAGRLASALPTFKFEPLKSVYGAAVLPKVIRGTANPVELSAAKSLAIQAGMGLGGGVVGPLVQGQRPTTQGVTEALAQTLLFGEPRFGKSVPSPKGGESDASSQSKTAEVHGDVPAQPGSSTGQVPVEKGGKRVQPPKAKSPVPSEDEIVEKQVPDEELFAGLKEGHEDEVKLRTANKVAPAALNRDFVDENFADIRNAAKQLTGDEMNPTSIAGRALVNELRRRFNEFSTLNEWEAYRDMKDSELDKASAENRLTPDQGMRGQYAHEALQLIADHGIRLGFSKGIQDRAKEIVANRRKPLEAAAAGVTVANDEAERQRKIAAAKTTTPVTTPGTKPIAQMTPEEFYAAHGLTYPASGDAADEVRRAYFSALKMAIRNKQPILRQALAHVFRTPVEKVVVPGVRSFERGGDVRVPPNYRLQGDQYVYVEPKPAAPEAPVPTELQSPPKTGQVEHKAAVESAIESNKPVNREAVDKYKITLPENYVADGGRYAPKESLPPWHPLLQELWGDSEPPPKGPSRVFTKGDYSREDINNYIERALNDWKIPADEIKRILSQTGPRTVGDYFYDPTSLARWDRINKPEWVYQRDRNARIAESYREVGEPVPKEYLVDETPLTRKQIREENKKTYGEPQLQEWEEWYGHRAWARKVLKETETPEIRKYYRELGDHPDEPYTDDDIKEATESLPVAQKFLDKMQAKWGTSQPHIFRKYRSLGWGKKEFLKYKEKRYTQPEPVQGPKNRPLQAGDRVTRTVDDGYGPRLQHGVVVMENGVQVVRYGPPNYEGYSNEIGAWDRTGQSLPPIEHTPYTREQFSADLKKAARIKTQKNLDTLESTLESVAPGITDRSHQLIDKLRAATAAQGWIPDSMEARYIPPKQVGDEIVAKLAAAAKAQQRVDADNPTADPAAARALLKDAKALLDRADKILAQPMGKKPASMATAEQKSQAEHRVREQILNHAAVSDEDVVRFGIELPEGYQKDGGQWVWGTSMGGQRYGFPPDKTELAVLTDAARMTAEANPKGPLLRKAFTLGQKIESAKETWKKAISGLDVATSALMERIRGRPVVTSLDEVKGERKLALTESVLNNREFSDIHKRAVPDPVRRGGIAVWLDTGGNPVLLTDMEIRAPDWAKKYFKAAQNLTPDELHIAANAQLYFETKWRKAADMGLLKDAIANYIHRMYESNPEWANKTVADVQTGISTARRGWQQRRSYKYDLDAMLAGLKPNMDYVDRIAAYDWSVNKAIADRIAVKGMMNVRMADGRPMIDVAGLGKPIDSGDEEVPYNLLVYPHFKRQLALSENMTPEEVQKAIANNRSDYKTKDYPVLRKWKWVETDETGKKTMVQGDVLIHPDAVRDLEVIFEPSKVRRFKIGNVPVGRIALQTGALFKQTALDLSLFHPVQIMLHGLEHRVFEPFNEKMAKAMGMEMTNIDMNDADTRGLVKGGMQVVDYNHRANFEEGLSGSSLTKWIPIVGPKMESYNRWLFEDYIPRLKTKMALHALERNRARYPELSESELYAKTAKEANAAFGELDWEYMGYNKTTVDALRLGLLAPDFLFARAAFVGQALSVVPALGAGQKSYHQEQAVAFFGALTAMYITARILNKMVSGEYQFDYKNAFSIVIPNRDEFPKDLRGKAFGLRTVQGDVLHLMTDFSGFWYNRLNPVFGRTVTEGLTRRDQFGRQRNGWQQLQDFGRTIVPISLRGIPMLSGREQGILESFLNAMGVTARRNTAIDNIFRLAESYKQKRGIAEPSERIYDPDKDVYRGIKLAALYGNPDDVSKEIKLALSKNVTDPEKLYRHFRDYTTRPFSGSNEHEEEFYNGLSEDRRKMYADALDERERLVENLEKGWNLLEKGEEPKRGYAIFGNE